MHNANDNDKSMRNLSLIFIFVIFIQSVGSTQPCLPEGIQLTSQQQIDDFQINYPGCTEIEGSVLIGDWEPTDISNLEGLIDITSIGGYLWLELNPILTNLSGLNNLTSIGGGLMIGNWEHPNPALVSLEGLESLNTIGGYVYIEYNSITSFTGLDNLTSIGGDLRISINSELMSLEGLQGLTSIGGTIEIVHNNSLISLTGLDNIDSATINGLLIASNPLLTDCVIKSICDYLVSPNSIVDIHNNGSGCNSQEEVEEACLTDITAIFSRPVIFIYPNPAKNELSILNKSNQNFIEINIYNQVGQKVLNTNGLSKKIAITNLNQGLYIVELVSTENKIRKKLIIK